MQSKLIVATLALLFTAACTTATTAPRASTASGTTTPKDSDNLGRNGYRRQPSRTGTPWSDPTNPSTEELLKDLN